MTRTLEIDDPTTRAIIVAYHNAEMRRAGHAIRHLQFSYSTLGEIIKNTMDGYDPIEKDREVIAELTEIREGLDQLIARMDAGSDVTDVARMIRDTETAITLWYGFSQVRQRTSIEKANTVRAIAAEKQIDTNQVIDNQVYMDEVTRRVFPTRQDAQRYIELSQRANNGAMKVVRDFFALPDPIGKKMVSSGIQLPSDEALNALQRETLKYAASELNRIYAGIGNR
ncbi:hypothetical protein HYY70_03295 [Candidatus Woesearchaeota archaeon]|nr:hypothetical protein [Candidatus Woesearchaeota archaeon]